MITAENITREQIQKLWQSSQGTGNSHVDADADTMHTCTVALAEHHVQCGAVMCSTLCVADFDAEGTWSARARCAEILNHRQATEGSK